ncbi:hypothetical protein TWF718_009833 [Orbilia javanica]|uniref:Uncharacterized protein n=1 Tax=Orbilia javanica TaxID=47235 RepID=A0AAN8RBR4_9PEZI
MATRSTFPRLNRSDRFSSHHNLRFQWIAFASHRRINLSPKGSRTIKIELTSRNAIRPRGDNDSVFDNCVITFPTTSAATSHELKLSFNPCIIEGYTALGNGSFVIYLDGDLEHPSFAVEERRPPSEQYTQCISKKGTLVKYLTEDFWKHKVIILGGAPSDILQQFCQKFRLYNAALPLDIAMNPAACALLRRRIISFRNIRLDQIFPKISPPIDAREQQYIIKRACEVHEVENWQAILDTVEGRSGDFAHDLSTSELYVNNELFTNEALATIAWVSVWSREQSPRPRFYVFPLNHQSRIPRGIFSIQQDDYFLQYGPDPEQEPDECDEEGLMMVWGGNGVPKPHGRGQGALKPPIPKLLEWSIQHYAKQRKYDTSQQLASYFDGVNIKTKYESRFRTINEGLVAALIRSYTSRCEAREGMSHPPQYSPDVESNYVDLARRSRLRPSRKELTWLIIRRHINARWPKLIVEYEELLERQTPAARTWFTLQERSYCKKLSRAPIIP